MLSQAESESGYGCSCSHRPENQAQLEKDGYGWISGCQILMLLRLTNQEVQSVRS